MRHFSLNLAFAAAAFAAATFTASTAAWSSSNYPGEVVNHLGGDTPFPACTICHETNAGGFGTITKAHGISLQDAGLVAADLTSLDDALDALEADGTDSDGGGVGDVDELRAGTDPNIGDDDDSDPTGTGPVQFGFGCNAGAGAGDVAAFLFVGLAFWRSRRRHV